MKTSQTKKIITVIMLICMTAVLQAQTTIVVDWALDEVPGSNKHTCTYSLGAGGSFYGPADDGFCTIRRALREAGARPQADRPITIVFTGLNGTDGNSDDTQFNGVQWVLPVSDAGTSSEFGLFPESITDVVGNVNVMGPSVDVQGDNEMPKIMIEYGETLPIEMSDVTIQGLGFYGGMSLHAKEENITIQNNTWGLDPTGMETVFFDPDFFINTLSGEHGVISSNKAENLLVQNNIITGASTYAVEISSNTMGVQILSNWMGTNINGEVPEVPEEFKCRTFTTISPDLDDLDDSEWFAGAGISGSGTGMLIQDNVIAGLQNIRSTNDTPPEALTVFGAMHIIENNVIGQDVNGQSVGVCGQGIKYSNQRSNTVNNGHLVIDNIIDSSRNGFENTKGAILWTDTSVSSFLDSGTSIRGNIIIDGPEKYFEIGPLLSDAIKLFEPAEITSVNGTLVTGGSNTSNIMSNPSPCPNCLIDFYLDDGDDSEEALEYLGEVEADSNGDFTFTLAEPLPDGFGIRTTSTSISDGVIGNTWAGQTSTLSNEVYGLVTDVIFKNDFE